MLNQERIICFLKRSYWISGALGSLMILASLGIIMMFGFKLIPGNFNYYIHYSIPGILGKLLLMVWCCYFIIRKESDKELKGYAIQLLILYICNIIFSITDNKAAIIFLIQGFTLAASSAFLMLILFRLRYLTASKSKTVIILNLNAVVFLCLITGIGLAVLNFSKMYLQAFLLGILGQTLFTASVVVIGKLSK